VSTGMAWNTPSLLPLNQVGRYRRIAAAGRGRRLLSPLLSEMIPMTDKDMLFLAGLAGFAWWTYVFLPLVWFHS
jgi:hypothetical protein